MKKISLSISLDECRLNSTEMKNVTGGNGCTYTDTSGAQTRGLSEGQAQQMADQEGGGYSC